MVEYLVSPLSVRGYATCAGCGDACDVVTAATIISRNYADKDGMGNARISATQTHLLCRDCSKKPVWQTA